MGGLSLEPIRTYLFITINMRIPSNNRWTQTNDGDIFGVLKKSIGVSFDEMGVVQVPGKPVAYYTENDDANFDLPISIQYFNSTYNVVTADNLFHGDFDGNALTEDATGDTNDAGGDGIVVFGRLYISGTTKLQYWDGATYTDSGVTYSSIDYRPLCEFESQSADKLAVAKDNVVTLYDSAHAAGNSLTLPANLKVTSMRYRNNFLYIGCRHIEGGEARVYLWDGSGSAFQYSVPTHSSWVFSMAEHQGSIVFVTERGELRLITGTSSQQIATFPVYHASGKQWAADIDTYGKVLNRGMVSDGDRIFISVYGNTVTDLVEGMYSGLWTFDPQVGLYHRAGVTDDRVDTDASPSSISDDTITMDANHGGETGDPIFVLNAGSVTGITAARLYRCIKVNDTDFQFADNLYDAKNGVPVQLSGSIGALSIRFLENDTVGEIYGCEGGAVALLNSIEFPEEMWAHGGIIYGGNTDVGIGTVMMIAPGRGWGSITTQKILASRVTEIWKKLHLILKNLVMAVEKVVVKIKTEEKVGLPLPPSSVTWSDTDTFTTGDLQNWGAVSVGDEVLILSGYGAGKTAHVSSISAGASEYTVNLDDTIGKSSETSTVEVDNFKKVNEVLATDPNPTYPDFLLPNEKAPWLQVKVEFQGFEPALYYMELENSKDK